MTLRPEAEIALMDLEKCRTGTTALDPELMEAVPAVFDRDYRSVADGASPQIMW